MAYTVGELARITGVTVRALHHYDDIGLVVPSQRSAAGYRLYGDRDVLRLQQVLLFRQLGMALAEIAPVLDDPSFDRVAALRQHREVLVGKRARLDAMLAALDAAVRLEEVTMTEEQVKSLFDGFSPEQYEDEARERWGNTDAYKESARRAKQYGKAEWEAIRRESDAIYAGLAALMQAGVAVGDARVRELVDAHRAHIDRWFYPCSRDMQRGLGEMYVADPRFAANLDKLAPGFARYLRDAIAATVSE
jgi:DNA-binding transcriptional MerR regulator